jgi:CBS domain-containing protein
MRLGDLLTADRITVPLEADSPGEALRRLLPEEETADWEADEGEARLQRLRGGEGGSVRRASPHALVLSLRAGEPDRPWAALGVTKEPIEGAPGEGKEEGDAVRIVLVVRLPKGPEFGAGALEGLVHALGDPAVARRLLDAASGEDVREIEPLMATDLAEPLRVEHVLTPLAYRVFPDTPAGEVVDLMARRDLRVLPVVGEELQVLGMVTADEALKYALESLETGEGTGPSSATARDMMSRAVLCVSEDQDLLDAAALMAKRDVGHLPVVRDGEIVGVLARDAVLKAVFERR